MFKALLPGYMIALIIFHLYTLLTIVMTKFLSIILILLCMSILLRQTFEYANQIPCENNPQNVISLDPDTDQFYVLTPQPN